VFEQARTLIHDLLTESRKWTDQRQRLTATRLHEMLRKEGHTVGVTLVKEAVAEWKRQRQEVHIPLVYRPGDLGEVDFFQVVVDEDGHGRRAWLFLLRLMYSGLWALKTMLPALKSSYGPSSAPSTTTNQLVTTMPASRINPFSELMRRLRVLAFRATIRLALMAPTRGGGCGGLPVAWARLSPRDCRPARAPHWVVGS